MLLVRRTIRENSVSRCSSLNYARTQEALPPRRLTKETNGLRFGNPQECFDLHMTCIISRSIPLPNFPRCLQSTLGSWLMTGHTRSLHPLPIPATAHLLMDRCIRSHRLPSKGATQIPGAAIIVMLQPMVRSCEISALIHPLLNRYLEGKRGSVVQKSPAGPRTLALFNA